MVFYAYISEINNDVVWRILLTFSSAGIADEWWRAVSTSPNDFLTKSVQRVNPEFYTHNTTFFNIYSFYDDARLKDISAKFRGKLIMTLLNDRGGRGLETILNHSPVVDRVSGNWFYIRSTSDRTTYWYYNSSTNRVTTSKSNRTMFQVTGSKLSDKAVLIGTDDVSLKMYPDTDISINSTGDLISGLSDWVFDFGNLASGRFVARDWGVVFENVDAGAPRKPGWELVN
ncbi:hypothetical protein ONZ45_g15047 [Pleurotus djamor]|nr:hypothetical protein ONZ45_g15047 [Pleurotus djamor]